MFSISKPCKFGFDGDWLPKTSKTKLSARCLRGAESRGLQNTKHERDSNSKITGQRIKGPVRKRRIGCITFLSMARSRKSISTQSIILTPFLSDQVYQSHGQRIQHNASKETKCSSPSSGYKNAHARSHTGGTPREAYDTGSTT